MKRQCGMIAGMRTYIGREMGVGVDMGFKVHMSTTVRCIWEGFRWYGVLL
jgi:hypothetical protein